MGSTLRDYGLEFGMDVRVVGAAMLAVCAAAHGQAAAVPAPAATQESRAVAQGNPAPVQESQGATLQDELKKLGAEALSLQRDLPSFECNETGLSQAMKKGKVKEQVRFVADVRVERAKAGRLNEELNVTEVNGKPYSGGRFEPPFMVRGGFGEALFFFLPEAQTCFHYTLSYAGSQGRVDFESPPGSFDRPECRDMGAPRGFALLDDAGNATHVERQVQPEYADQVHAVDFAGVDFAPTELDGKVYPLASKVVADVAKKGGVTLRFEATYTGCHLFKATSTILPGMTVVPDTGAPHP